jgi:hypothetical protein
MNTQLFLPRDIILNLHRSELNKFSVGISMKCFQTAIFWEYNLLFTPKHKKRARNVDLTQQSDSNKHTIV